MSTAVNLTPAAITAVAITPAAEAGDKVTEFLLGYDNIQINNKTEETKMEKWKCTVCGYIHEGPITPDFKCPVCKQPAEKFVKIEDAAPAKNL